MIFFFTISFFLNTLMVFFFHNLSSVVNLFDKPDGKRKMHKKPVAAVGGVLIFVNLTSYLIFLLLPNSFFDNEIINFEKLDFVIFYVFLSLFFLIGYLDDKFEMGPNLKLIIFSFLISLALFFSESMSLTHLNFSFSKDAVNITAISLPFTILCILLFINAFNMFDGINLQSSVYSLHIFLMFIFQGVFVDISIVMILSLVFFSYLNFKNKCFLGNNGSLLIAFIISFLFIKSQSTQHLFFADQIFLAMQIPGLDLLRLAIQRGLANKHPFHPDRNHIHHLLLKRYGYGKALLFLSTAIIVPNYLSFLYGNTIYYIILTLVAYSFAIFKLQKNI
jgi:UDP-GlcNAc:undecaprenyl-phosphate/decaprenyl-phosphate GlcNAc-1-phosphate transferase